MLPELTKITLGTGGVTHPGDPEEVKCIRKAMEAKLWMHCANYGNGAFQNLKLAFDEAPSQIPKTIFKVDGITAAGFRDTIRSFLAQVGLERMDIAQVCGFPLSEEPDAVLEAMQQAKDEGLTDHFIMDIIPQYCRQTVDIIARELFEGYIFYYSTVESSVNQEVMAAAQAKKIPFLAMRVFAGGELWDQEKCPPYVHEIFRKSGCSSLVEFCVHGSLSLPLSVTAIVGTGKTKHFDELMAAAESYAPLSPELVDELVNNHHAWNGKQGVDFG